MKDEITDQEFGYQVVLGAVVGIVVMFVVMAVAMLFITGIEDTVPAMAWAAIVGGGFFGGTVTLSLTLGRVEKAEKAERAARRAAQAAASERAGTEAA